jgi:hypothetical protein
LGSLTLKKLKHWLRLVMLELNSVIKNFINNNLDDYADIYIWLDSLPKEKFKEARKKIKKQIKLFEETLLSDSRTNPLLENSLIAFEIYKALSKNKIDSRQVFGDYRERFPHQLGQIIYLTELIGVTPPPPGHADHKIFFENLDNTSQNLISHYLNDHDNYLDSMVYYLHITPKEKYGFISLYADLLTFDRELSRAVGLNDKKEWFEWVLFEYFGMFHIDHELMFENDKKWFKSKDKIKELIKQKERCTHVANTIWNILKKSEIDFDKNNAVNATSYEDWVNLQTMYKILKTCDAKKRGLSLEEFLILEEGRTHNHLGSAL